MPVVLREGPYRFYFFSNEGKEPPHIHVTSAENHAKFWLQPVRLAESDGFNRPELRRVQSIIEKHRIALINAWNAYFEI